MNELPPLDPQLQALEAQLTDTAPRLSPAVQADVLYRCAFAAGEKSVAPRLHKWRLASAALAVLWLCTSIPLTTERVLIARRDPKPPQESPVPAPPSPSPREESNPLPFTAKQEIVSVDLDAWQIPDDPVQQWNQEIQAFHRQDPAIKQHAMGALRASGLQ